MKKMYVMFLITGLLFGILCSCSSDNLSAELTTTKASEETSTDKKSQTTETLDNTSQTTEPANTGEPPPMLIFKDINQVFEFDKFVNLDDEEFEKYRREHMNNTFITRKEEYIDVLKKLNGVYLPIKDNMSDITIYYETNLMFVHYDIPTWITIYIECDKNTAREKFESIKSNDKAALTLISEMDGFKFFHYNNQDERQDDVESYIADVDGYYLIFRIFNENNKMDNYELKQLLNSFEFKKVQYDLSKE